MWSRCLIALIAAVSIEAQPSPSERLLLVQAKVVESLDRIPKYMCTQTIDRSRFERNVPTGTPGCDAGRPAPATHMTSSDRLRLDVAMTSTVEMYSWVGRSQFDDRSLLDLVDNGAISTGNFAGFLNMIFRKDTASFSFLGDHNENGRVLAEFRFSVPHEKSHYYYSVAGEPGHRVVTGYDGTFLADAKTGDLVRLEVSTSRLPAETGACYSTTSMNYVPVHVGDSTILLPAESRLLLLHVN